MIGWRYPSVMRNQWILYGYLAFFFTVVSSYDLYSDNTYLVALAGISLGVVGLIAWVWSIQPKKDKGN